MPENDLSTVVRESLESLWWTKQHTCLLPSLLEEVSSRSGRTVAASEVFTADAIEFIRKQGNQTFVWGSVLSAARKNTPLPFTSNSLTEAFEELMQLAVDHITKAKLK